MDPSSPLRNDARNDSGARSCPVCGHSFVPSGRQQVCSAACRQMSWRRRHPPLAYSIPERAPRVATVYECPTCETRFLGVQRCDNCGVFCRRVGPGGPCPHCDEPVALADLLLLDERR